MPNYADAGVWLGIACSVVVFLITLYYQRRLDLIDLGVVGATFLAASNILPALYLCYYGATTNLNQNLPPELKGYERYITFAGIASVFISLVTVWVCIQKASTPPKARARNR